MAKRIPLLFLVLLLFLLRRRLFFFFDFFRFRPFQAAKAEEGPTGLEWRLKPELSLTVPFQTRTPVVRVSAGPGSYRGCGEQYLRLRGLCRHFQGTVHILQVPHVSLVPAEDSEKPMGVATPAAHPWANQLPVIGSDRPLLTGRKAHPHVRIPRKRCNARNKLWFNNVPILSPRGIARALHSNSAGRSEAQQSLVECKISILRRRSDDSLHPSHEEVHCFATVASARPLVCHSAQLL